MSVDRTAEFVGLAQRAARYWQQDVEIMIGLSDSPKVTRTHRGAFFLYLTLTGWTEAEILAQTQLTPYVVKSSLRWGETLKDKNPGEWTSFLAAMEGEDISALPGIRTKWLVHELARRGWGVRLIPGGSSFAMDVRMPEEVE